MHGKKPFWNPAFPSNAWPVNKRKLAANDKDLDKLDKLSKISSNPIYQTLTVPFNSVESHKKLSKLL